MLCDICGKNTATVHLTEIIDEQIAQADYQLKVQAKNFWNLLAGLEEFRQGVIEAAKRPPP